MTKRPAERRVAEHPPGKDWRHCRRQTARQKAIRHARYEAAVDHQWTVRVSEGPKRIVIPVSSDRPADREKSACPRTRARPIRQRDPSCLSPPERLTFVAGVTGYPPLSEEIRSDDALVSVGRALRAVPRRKPRLRDVERRPRSELRACRSSRGGLHRPQRPRAVQHRLRRQRLQLFVDSYGLGVEARKLVDTAVIRLYGTGAYIAGEVAKQNPAFAENHAAGYLKAAQSLFSCVTLWCKGPNEPSRLLDR